MEQIIPVMPIPDFQKLRKSLSLTFPLILTSVVGVQGAGPKLLYQEFRIRLKILG